VNLGVAKETDGDVPLTGISATLQPDLFTGTLTGSIPIEVPPGRNGMQPNLALSYASSGGNGWLGMGWKLEMGTIERQTRWGVLYTPTSQDELDGKVYTMRLNGVSVDLVQAPPPAPSDEYRAKFEGSFLRIKKLSADGMAGWEITDTKGTKYKFGTGVNTRIQGIAGGYGMQIFKWCLERVEDRDGNYMTVIYTGDQGQGYLSQIDYTGNGATAPTNQVKFYLEDRTDKPVMYTSNFTIITAKRLKTIEVKANGNLVGAYKLTYSPSSSTTRSLLTGVEPFGKDAVVDQVTGTITPGTGPQGPKLTVLSTNAPLAMNRVDYTGLTFDRFYPGLSLQGDYNGDGKTDMLTMTALGIGTSAATVMYSATGGGFTSASYTGLTFMGIASGPWNIPGDYNGDGKTDIFAANAVGQVYVSYATGSGFTSATYTGFTFHNITPDVNIAGDYNGDGKTDMLTVTAFGAGTGQARVLYSTGSGFTQVLYPGLTFNATPAFNLPGDYNGDGMTDILVVTATGVGTGQATVLYATGSGFAYAAFTGLTFNATPAWNIPGDYNGDGKTDILTVTATGTGTGQATVLYATGNPTDGFTSATYTGLTFNTDSTMHAPGDYNGDGKTDILTVTATGIGNGQATVLYATGSGFTPAAYTGLTFGIDSARRYPGDYNGDGNADLLTVTAIGTGTGQAAVNYASASPDLLAGVLNGLGGATTVTYTPSTEWSNQQLPYPVRTATAMTTCDNWNNSTSTCTGNSSTTTYSYTGGYHQRGERDFRGFKTVVVTSPGASDADKTVATTWFHQGNELTPIDTENPGLANGYMKDHPYRVEVRRKSDSFLYTQTQTTYHDDRIGANTTAPWFTPPSQVDAVVCDGGPCVTTRVAIAAADYDAYGNVLRESHYGDVNVPGDEKTVERAFIPPNTTDYLVSFPARETIYQGVPSGNKLAETFFYYDGTGTGACTAAPTGSNSAVTKGKLTKTERWLNGGTNPIGGIEYDPTKGVLLCTRDPLGNKTTMVYDPTKTFVLSTTNQLSHVTTTVYYGVNLEPIPTATGFYGRVKSVTDPNGKIVTHEYDALGRNTKTTAPDGLTTQVTYPTLAEFGVIGTQKVSTSTSGASLPAALTNSAFFDGLGRTFKKESSGPNSTTLVTETQYDVKGQVFRTSLPYFKTTESNVGRWRTMTYDTLGRVIQVAHPDTLSGTALTSKSCYAPFVTVMLDPSGARKRETKDAYGRVVKIEEYSTTASTCDTAVGTPYATTNYTYDLLGNLTKVVDALGNRTTMRYDTLSRKIGMSDPDMSTNGTNTCGDLTALNPSTAYPWYAAPCWNYQYDAAGNLTRQTDAKTQHLWFRYDGLNRRSQKDYTTQKALGSGDVRYIYDDTVTTFNRNGRLKQVIDAAMNVTFEYDTMGRVSKSTKVLDGTTYVTTSLYDGLGRLKEVTYPTATPKTVEYLYTGPVLERVRDKTGSGTTIYAIYSNYTSQGQAQTITYGNGVVTTSTFADAAHPACIPATSFKLCTLKTQKGTTPAYQDLTYTFTADGNLDLITDPINGNQDFGYDGLDRLTSATGPYDNGATITRTYTYNEIGNILTNSWLTAGTYTYPTSGAGVVRPHAVQIAGPYQYSYDNNGNQTGITSTLGDYSSSTTFNVDNRLASAVTTFGSTTINSTFVYDGDGGRVKKIVGTTTTRYISKLYECDTTGTTTSCSRFIWAGDTRIATVAVTSGAVHYWHGDHLGSSSVITDSTGAKVQALTYQPHGGVSTNQSFTTPAVDVPYKYTGKEFDYSTDFYYYESRYYDPWFGRFISPDTIMESLSNPQLLNRYSYVSNNPLRYTDPSGYCFIVCVKFSKKDLSTLRTVGGVVAEFVPGLQPLGVYLLTTTKTGRYILAGEIVAASAVATFYCGGCGATVTVGGITMATIPAAATVGAVGVGTLGAISAANAGGDISTGLLFGTALGAVAGATNGYLGVTFAPTETFSWSGAFWGQAAVSGLATMTGGAILNGASGAAIGFAGGRGNWDTILQTAGRSIAAGVTTNAATTLLGLTWGALPDSGKYAFSWDVDVVGFPVELRIPKSLALDVGNTLKLFGGNAPQKDELSNRDLYRQVGR
jgi:RHS repeat-associated protein